MANLDKYDYKEVLDALFNENTFISPFVRHHIDSYNTFLDNVIWQIVEQKNPIIVETEYVQSSKAGEEKKNIKSIRHVIEFKNVFIMKPHCTTLNGEKKAVFPNSARMFNQTYSFEVYASIFHQVKLVDSNDKETLLDKVEVKEPIKIGVVPAMVKSKICVTNELSREDLYKISEDPYDLGGYFIVNGNEYVIITQEQKIDNYMYLNKKEKAGVIEYEVMVQSKIDGKYDYSSRTDLIIDPKDELYIILRLGGQKPVKIPYAVMMRALGIISDKEIAEITIYDTTAPELIEKIKPSLMRKVKDPTTGKDIYIQTQEKALVYLASEIGNKIKAQNIPEAVKYASFDILEKQLLPHLGKFINSRKKAYYLGYMANRAIRAKLGMLEVDDRDVYGNKRLLASGAQIAHLFRYYYNMLVKELKKSIQNEITGRTYATQGLENMVHRLWKNSKLENGIRRNVNTGSWPTGGKVFSEKKGVSQRMERKTRVDMISFLRRVRTQVQNTKSGKNQEMHRLQQTHIGFIDPIETPEGREIGLVKHLAITAKISQYSNPKPVYEFLDTWEGRKYIQDLNPTDINKYTKVIVNGNWYCSVSDPKALHTRLIELRRSKVLNMETTIIRDHLNDEIRIFTDEGRIIRPLYIVDSVMTDGTGSTNAPVKNTLRINKDIINGLHDGKYTWDTLLIGIEDKGSASGGAPSKVATPPRPFIEYLDIHEIMHNCTIAMSQELLYSPEGQKGIYTHCEIHPITMLGVNCGLIPLPDHNQAPRNLFQGAMGKQAMSIYTLSYQNRLDSIGTVLYYPEIPLVSTVVAKYCDYNTIPAGMNAIVAIMCYTGYNQEDAVILNRNSIERGMFGLLFFKTYEGELTGTTEEFKKPEKGKTELYKYNQSYDALDEDGMPRIGAILHKGDIIIGKVQKIERGDRESSKGFEYKDRSMEYKENDPGVVDKVIISDDPEGTKFAKVRIRMNRPPVVGDKFSCLTPDHEVLTKNRGWVPIADITLQDKVAVLKENTQDILDYAQPTDLHTYTRADLPLITFETHGIKDSLVTTEDHRVLVQYLNNANYVLTQARTVKTSQVPFRFKRSCTREESMTQYSEFQIPSLQSLDAYTVPMSSWITLIARYYSDSVGIDQNKGEISFKFPKKTSLTKVYEALADTFKATMTTTNTVIVLKSAQLCAYLQTLTEKLPLIIWSFTKNQCEALLSKIVCDCTVSSIYHTLSLVFAGEIQRLALHSQKFAKIDFPAQGASPPYYTVRIYEKSEEEKLIHPVPNVTTKTGYTGTIHCITVPGEVFYTRRAGTATSLIPCWTGNSRHGQKGTTSLLLPQEDLPFTEDGIIPDIIINPHAITSRMTIAHLLEALLSKVSAIKCRLSDGTPFDGINVEDIAKELEGLGYDRTGNEYMYNGFTGEKMKVKIFITATYYQRLKHLTSEKWFSRSTGTNERLTRQPISGRAQQGGVRFGEMEVSSAYASGLACTLKELFVEKSDKYACYVCELCGLVCVGNEKRDIYECKNCKNNSHIAKIQTNWCGILMLNELISLGIAPRIRVQKSEI